MVARISIVINADTRPGCGAEVNTTGDHGAGSLNGVRSLDFFTDGVRNKLNFFAGHAVELILYVDEHEPLPEEVRGEINTMLSSGRIQQFVCQPHQRSSARWNETIYLEALKLATGKYVAHFDGDCAAFRDPNSAIILNYIGWLESGGYKFVCQPTTMSLADHGMWWASSRFFICRRDTLDFEELEKCVLDEGYRTEKYGHCPALEHVLGRMATLRESPEYRGVLYPPADWSDYLVFSWSRYHRGVLSKLNAMPYKEVRDYVLSCGLHGPNDLISVPI